MRRLFLSLFAFFNPDTSDLIRLRVCFADFLAALTAFFVAFFARFAVLRPVRASVLLDSFRSTLRVARLMPFAARLTRFATALFALARSFANLLFFPERRPIKFLQIGVFGCSFQHRSFFSCPCVLSVPFLAARSREFPADHLLCNRHAQLRRTLKTFAGRRLQ